MMKTHGMLGRVWSGFLVEAVHFLLGVAGMKWALGVILGVTYLNRLVPIGTEAKWGIAFLLYFAWSAKTGKEG